MTQKHPQGKILSAPITIISLIVLIAIGAYLALYIRQTNQTPNPTTSETPSVTNQTTSNTSDTSTDFDSSDGNTASNVDFYDNQIYGFRFEFPKDKCSGYGNDKTYTVTCGSVKFQTFAPQFEGGFEDEEPLPAKKIAELFNIDGSQYSSGITRFQSTIKDNPTFGKVVLRYLISTKKNVDIMFTYPENESTISRALIDQILATFKFTD